MTDFIPAYEEPEEHDVILGSTTHSKPRYPSTAVGGESWESFFARLAANKPSAIAAATEDEEDDEDAIELDEPLSVDLSPSEDGLGRSVAGMLERLRGGGWDVAVCQSVARVPDTFYAADSKRKPGQEQPDHRRGDMKKAAHEVTHWWAHATYRRLRLGVALHWTEGVTPKGARSFGFKQAMCVDPLGMPSELFVDYTPKSYMFNRADKETDASHAQRVAEVKQNALRQDLQYNLGQSYLNTRPNFDRAGDFDLWLTEWQAQIDRIEEKKEVPDAHEAQAEWSAD